MKIGRFQSGVGVLFCAVGWLCLASCDARAQDSAKSAPSPVAPGDLSKPVFDTTTPVYSPGPNDKSGSAIAAEVEGRPITLGNVGDAIAALPFSLKQLSLNQLYPGVLERLIKQQALVVRAQQAGNDEDPVIRRKIREAADNALADEYLAREIGKKITEKDLLARYDRDYAGKPGPEEVRVRVIMVATEKEAADLISEIRGGADFAAVARGASKDASAANGGDVGFSTRDGMTAEIGAVAFALPAGQMAVFPVFSVGSWFVVRTEERRRGATPGFAEVRGQLTRQMLEEGVPAATEAALNGLHVRRYGLSGKEVEEQPTDAK
jgi:peptidyl-prolyl cis-trans isomerase C